MTFNTPDGIEDDDAMVHPVEIHTKETVVVVGNGMVGQRFCERLLDQDQTHHYKLVVFNDEPRHAYNRMALTQYFDHRDPEQVSTFDRLFL